MKFNMILIEKHKCLKNRFMIIQEKDCKSCDQWKCRSDDIYHLRHLYSSPRSHSSKDSLLYSMLSISNLSQSFRLFHILSYNIVWKSLYLTIGNQQSQWSRKCLSFLPSHLVLLELQKGKSEWSSELQQSLNPERLMLLQQFI